VDFACHPLTRKYLVNCLRVADTVKPIEDYVSCVGQEPAVAVDHEETLAVGGDIEVAAKAQVGDTEEPAFRDWRQKLGKPVFRCDVT